MSRPSPEPARAFAASLLAAAFAAAFVTTASGCGGAGDDGAAVSTIDPLAAGAGTFFASDFLGSDAAFYKVDGFSGDTVQQPNSEGTGAVTRCPALAAMDARPDGVVLAVAARGAALYEANPRNSLCRLLAAMPETMAALAVRADGRIFTVSATNKLYQWDAAGRQLAVAPLLCASPGGCPVRGLDFSPAGTLFAIVAPGLWSRIDTTTAQLTSVRTGVGLSDDFDIDSQGTVRGLAGNELRVFDLGGLPNGRAVNVYGGTAFASGLVHR